MRSAEIILVVLAKIGSLGPFEGEAISLITESGMSSTGHFRLNRFSYAIVEAFCVGISISVSAAPICSVKRLKQIFAISGRAVPEV